jgi:drug/metabolite transporter (DMT)-like permease
LAALLALASAAFYGVSDFTGGLASRRAAAVSVVLVSNGLSLLVAVVVATLLPGSVLVRGDLAWGAAAGLVGLVGVVLLYRGLAVGPMSVVAPVTAVLAAAVPLLVGTARGERPGAPALAGVALALPAIVLLSRQRADARLRHAAITPAALVAALSAGLSFGGFYVLLAQTGPDGGAWPLVAQRVASVAVLVALVGTAAARGAGGLPHGRAFALGLAAGLSDVGANLAYVQSTHRGLLALVAVLSSLYPATTVLLARFLLGERLAPVQGAGLGMAAAAVVLIAIR